MSREGKLIVDWKASREFVLHSSHYQHLPLDFQITSLRESATNTATTTANKVPTHCCCLASAVNPTSQPPIHPSDKLTTASFTVAMRALNLLLPFLATATAQNLLIYSSTALPDCAQQCTLLQNAASGCVPPAAPVTNTVIYESCFCQSGYLTGVKAGSDSSVCADVCGADDVQKIGQWYRSNCQDNGVAAAAVVDAGGSSTSTTAGTAATSAAATGTSSGSKSTPAAIAEDEDGHHDW